MDTVTITPKRLKVYNQKAKERLSLPEQATTNHNVHVLGAARVDAGIRPVTVSTTVDAETGDVQTYSKTEPLPWVAMSHRGEAGIAYGIKSGPNGVTPNARLFVRQSLIDVKALQVGLEAKADQDGSLFAGASVAYRW